MTKICHAECEKTYRLGKSHDECDAHRSYICQTVFVLTYKCSDGNVEKQQQRIHRLGIPDIKRIKDRITGFIDGNLQVGVNHSKGNYAHKRISVRLAMVMAGIKPSVHAGSL